MAGFRDFLPVASAGLKTFGGPAGFAVGTAIDIGSGIFAGREAEAAEQEADRRWHKEIAKDHQKT